MPAAHARSLWREKWVVMSIEKSADLRWSADLMWRGSCGASLWVALQWYTMTLRCTIAVATMGWLPRSPFLNHACLTRSQKTARWCLPQ